MAAPTKCDIIRDGAQALIGGKCKSKQPKSPQNHGVHGDESIPAACHITQLATKKDMYFKKKYDPSGLVSGSARMIRKDELGALQNDIDADTTRLEREYGLDAPTDITWDDFTECLWNPAGYPGGPHSNKYFEREDIKLLGYRPQPLFGAKALEGALPATLASHVPVWLDRVFNPDLAIVLIFVVLVVVFAALMYRAHRPAPAPSEKGDPLHEKGGTQPSPREAAPESPEAVWKALVPAYEAEGYDMAAYREKLGMPPKGG